MTVKAEKAIKFKCEKCGHIQLSEYTLELGWYQDRSVNEDSILCERCGYDQHVIEEL